MAQRTIEHKASTTAWQTCIARACATRERDERFRGRDEMAEILLPLGAKLMLNVTPLRRFYLKMSPPGSYEYVLARTKLLDEVFVQALANRFFQIVLLGAGFDTRALRFAGLNQGTKIFELDIETTQQPKIDILTRKKVALPPELVFVPIDFNRQSLAEALFGAGYVENQKSLFLWEGVTMYLTAEAVDSTLAFLRTSAAEGSIVAFDYIYASVLRRENRYYGEKELFDSISNAGEGWTFGIEEGAIGGFLAERGFELLAHYTPSELEKRYFMAEDGTLFRRINGTLCLAIAQTVRD